ncbi:MliC family protein [Chromobacterium aquaticum]|uniref:MliC family protein n=1 Tax=Chromobacterium aquaticum TaxID=467180 RepID=A0ABV8ZUX5_9NEIS|nr:MliC family protein [Chromobacterium aquaticum]MCD5360755.1 MliC family protein [Chromobacterium aquaticum]
MPGSAHRLIGLIILCPALALAAGRNDHGRGDGGHGRVADGGKPAEEATEAGAPVATDFNCDKPGNPVEAMVCQDDSLTRQDNRLEKVYAQALELAQQGRPGAESKLIAEQRRWVKSLKDCVKTEDMHMCLGDVYIMRITQLQAAWGLAPALTPLRYVCKGNATRTVLATFYRTHPPTVKLEYNGSTAILHQGLSGSGARYAAPGLELWIKGREASITWRGEPLDCSSQPSP